MPSIHVVFDEFNKVQIPSEPRIKGLHSSFIRLSDEFVFSEEEINNVAAQLSKLLLGLLK